MKNGDYQLLGFVIHERMTRGGVESKTVSAVIFDGIYTDEPRPYWEPEIDISEEQYEKLWTELKYGGDITLSLKEVRTIRAKETKHIVAFTIGGHATGELLVKVDQKRADMLAYHLEQAAA